MSVVTQSSIRLVAPLGVLLFTFVGIYTSLNVWPSLPSMRLGVGLFIILLVLILAARLYGNRWQILTLIGAILGVLWGASVGHWYDTWQLSDVEFQQDVTIVGRVTSVQDDSRFLRIGLSASRIGDNHYWIPRNLSLSWYETNTKLKVKDRLSVTARLKSRHSTANPFSFDAERWRLSLNQVANGYIVNTQPFAITSQSMSMRDRIILYLDALRLENKRWIKALSVADKSGLDQNDWTFLQHTGLAHLFAISGLHLGVVAGLSLAIISGSIRLIALVLDVSLPVHRFLPQISFKPFIYSACVVLTAGYAYLSDWQVPVLRAWVMLCLLFMGLWLRVKLSNAVIMCMLLVAIVLMFPYSIFSFSLWLSISAVAAILAILWRWPVLSTTYAHKAIQLVRIQCVLSLVMAPMSLAIFSTVPMIGVIANFIAIPVISLIIVPACVVNLVFIWLVPEIAEVGYIAIDAWLSWLFAIINAIQQRLEVTFEYPRFSILTLVCVGASIVFGLLPHFGQRYLLILISVMPLVVEIASSQSETQIDNWQIHVLDVGQGSSVLVTSKHAIMLIDTGASIGESSYAKRVAIPFIKANHSANLEYLIVSHDDDDHSGGVSDLQTHFTNLNILTAQECRRGQVFMWHSLIIRVLWPTQAFVTRYPEHDNNRSCVLHISDGASSLLYAGDIERAAEHRLLALESQLRNNGDVAYLHNVDVLIAPHHGSNTSSSWAFVGATRPKHVIYTTAHQNRWAFPHETVLQRYEFFGSKAWNTAKNGYIKIEITTNNPNVNVATWRQHIAPRWYRQIN